jgi:hypothetical protein
VSGAPRQEPRPPVELPAGVEHAGFQAYQRYRCRCGPCLEFHRAYQRRAAAIRRRIKYMPEGVVHGTKNTYNYYNCRCDECRAARASYDRERMEHVRKTEEYRRKGSGK